MSTQTDQYNFMDMVIDNNLNWQHCGSKHWFSEAKVKCWEYELWIGDARLDFYFRKDDGSLYRVITPNEGEERLI